ncbi:cyclic nucleotide-binding domain-containing protein [Defluviimonas aestuarii]|uniref:cyclic nucleotide-binding domain-containing protein n=1 Tax=Albidovulum aestuarii TaxID=1130726 RepID=UPI00249B60E1|nr:cyclic nucleotide-binding domain-containing protein [Defluviimonas aestuarii]MDI3337211.1 cyclic nucleotide-binding domain-containing protein [Defluviimonas aestuarii]
MLGLSHWWAEVDLLDVVGTMGVLGYVGAYFGLQIGVLKGDGYIFPAINLVSSLAVLISLTRDYNPFSVTIEICWSVISVIGMSRIYIVHRFIKLTDEQAEVVRRIVPSLKKDRARKFLNIGRFLDADEGMILTTQGQPIAALSMIMNGVCHIERGGRHIATITAGALVGELTLSSGEPATATVRTVTPARIFVIEREGLLRFLQRNPEALADLERSIAGDLRLKLAETSSRLSTALGE